MPVEGAVRSGHQAPQIGEVDESRSCPGLVRTEAGSGEDLLHLCDQRQGQVLKDLRQFSGEPKYEPEARAEVAISYLLHVWAAANGHRVHPLSEDELFAQASRVTDFGSVPGLVSHQTRAAWAGAVSKSGFVEFAWQPGHDDWLFKLSRGTPMFLPATTGKVGQRTVRLYTSLRDGFDGSATVLCLETGYVGQGGWLDVDGRASLVVRGSDADRPIAVYGDTILAADGPAAPVVVEGYPGVSAKTPRALTRKASPTAGNKAVQVAFSEEHLSLFHLSGDAVTTTVDVPQSSAGRVVFQGDQTLTDSGTSYQSELLSAEALLLPPRLTITPVSGVGRLSTGLRVQVTDGATVRLSGATCRVRVEGDGRLSADARIARLSARS